MKATLEVQHQAWCALMDTQLMHALKEAPLRVDFTRVRDHCAKFKASINSAELSEGELRTIKQAIPKLTFEKASWEDTQHAIGTIEIGTVHEWFNKIELEITLRKYMTCTPDNVEKDSNRATPAQLDKLEKMFINGEVRLHNCTLLTNKLERCKSRGCADEAVASSAYYGYCHSCHGELQEAIAIEEMPVEDTTAIPRPPGTDS